jgi:hypothetical protein
VSLFGHYVVIANWHLLQAFLECHQPHHKQSSHGMSQRSATVLAFQSFQCGMNIFRKNFLFLYWAADPSEK